MRNDLRHLNSTNFNDIPNINQQGVGLIEVMIALLLLAVAILGFTAMQMSAVKATDESVMRTRALTVIRGGSEMMRLNPASIPSFVTAVNATADTSSIDGVSSSSCLTSGSTQASCTPNQLATRDGLVIKNYAKDNDIDISLITCPGTGNTAATDTTAATSGQNIQCFVASWGTTAATLSDSNPVTGKTINCATSNGTYNQGAQCFIMEAY